MAKVIKKAQVGLSFLAKYAGREAAENLAKSTAKGAMRNELERGAEKMSLKNLPAEIVNKRAGESSYRPTSLSERLSGARDDFRSTVNSRNKMAGSSSNKSGRIEKDYKGDNFKYKKGGKTPKTKAKSGKTMLKRADGSYSQRGLWDNIRAAKGSGKKPTSAMLKQEKKIKAKTKK